MKKLLTLALFALLSNAIWAASPNTTPVNPFQDDLSRLDQAFEGMSELEQVVESRNATYATLAAENHPLLQEIISDTDVAGTLIGAVAPSGDKLLGIGGFWWGFCLGLIGIILVYTAIEGDARKEQGRKSMLGCLVGTIFWSVLYYLLLVALENNAG